MSTPEHKVKAKIKKILDDRLDVYYFMPVQMGYGARTLDFLGCSKGRAFAIEAKASGEELTGFQITIAEHMTRAGMQVFTIIGLETPAFAKLEAWLCM